MESKEREEQLRDFRLEFIHLRDATRNLTGTANALQSIASYIDNKELQGYADMLKDMTMALSSKCLQFDSRVSIVTKKGQQK